MDKAKILEWLENATYTVETARDEALEKTPKPKDYIANCNGKLNAFGVLEEKIKKGQFD